MARHGWFWHTAIFSQTSMTCCARKGKESNFSSHLSWVSDGPVAVFCSLRVNMNERVTSGRGTQIMLCWFCCIAGLWLVDCHAPWHILSASHTQDFTMCLFFWGFFFKANDWVAIQKELKQPEEKPWLESRSFFLNSTKVITHLISVFAETKEYRHSKECTLKRSLWCLTKDQNF